MSKIYQTNLKTIKNNFYDENIIDSNNDLTSKVELLKNDLYQNEEEIIDELINRKVSNNICCLNNENISSNIPKRNKSYNIKSKRISHSVDDKKAKKMKLSEWLKLNIENTKKIEEDVEDLIIEIFVNRYNSYPDTTSPLSPNALQSKKQLDLFCPKLFEFSVYIISILHQKFYSFFEYLTKKINFKCIPLNELNKIKEILKYTGIDLKKVFEKAFENTNNFNISSILIIMFDEYLIKENRIKEQIGHEIKNSLQYKEKERFEEYLKIVRQNLYFFNPNTETETEIETETEKETETETENNMSNGEAYDNDLNNNLNDYIIDNNNDEDNGEKEINIPEFNDDINDNNKNSEIVTNEEEEEKNNLNQEINKETTHIENNDNNNIESNEDNNNNSKKNKNIKVDNNIDNSNLIQNLNIDDLVNYINETDNKDIKKKKKKKKKGKKQEKNIIKEDIENNYVEEDLVFLNFKRSLEEFTKNALYTKKIKPKYSEEFLKRLQILSQ